MEGTETGCPETGCPETWCRLRAVGPDGTALATWVLAARRPPNLGHVELLARLKLASGRAGAVAVVIEVSPGLTRLLELTGLGQMGREPEEGKQGLGVEEGVVGGDPPP